MRNPLRPARLALLWLLDGVPLERHVAAVQRIDDGHQQQLARLRRTAINYDVVIRSGELPITDTQAAAFRGQALQ